MDRQKYKTIDELRESGRITPMMQQYLELKETHPDSILFFRLGDFYEMFFDDALVASEVLEITLTSRDKNDEPIPMCGVPHHSSRGYIAKLVEAGHKVAVCEQVEDPSAAKKLVKRDVVRVVTPGLVTDTELIESRLPRYLMAVHLLDDGTAGFAYIDVTTGEFRAGKVADARGLADEVGRVGPHELLYSAEGGDNGGEDDGGGGRKGPRPPEWVPVGVRAERVDEPPAPPRAAAMLAEHYGLKDLSGFELEDIGAGLSAAFSALEYVKLNLKGALANVRMLARHVGGDVMFVGETTQRNLELFYTLAGERRHSTLLSVLDRTRTAMGGREMRRRLLYPLVDHARINRRLDAVAELAARGETRRRIRDMLRSVSDVERLSGKVAMRTANPRDLWALKESLLQLPGLKEVVADSDALNLNEIADLIDPVEQCATLIGEALSEDPPVSATEGGVIREGFDSEIDELRAIQQGGRSWIAGLQAGEREATGISTLKIGFNKVFGYYIEVSRAKSAQVPEHYERRQTLANSERYITPELKEMEAKVLGAEERVNGLEYERFVALREAVAGYLERLRNTAWALARIDVKAALAELAVQNRYVKPSVHDGYELKIVGGRHPVVEAALTDERFVPNDVTFDEEANRLLVITGPNMSGKSTILRQTALIAMMAQLGSFVPAESASIGVVDRVFTRVGASDDLARGRSTFMVEMTETAAILANATRRSLVILDEIGRGTSTFDGLSIAWAVAEYIHEKGSRTLFATHYHELTDLARTLGGVANFNVAVKQWQGKIIFLRRLVEGGVSRSYGIEVAKLAGLPNEVIDRANRVLENLQSGELDETGLPKFANDPSHLTAAREKQLELFTGGGDYRKNMIIEDLAAMAVEELTPLDALVVLGELRKRARETSGG